MTAVGILFGGDLGEINFKSVLMLIYLGFVSAAAFSVWGMLMKYNNVSTVSIFGFMNPIFGVILSSKRSRRAAIKRSFLSLSW